MIPLPDTVTLHDFQRVSVEKFATVDHVGNFDDMGLGKTVQAVTLDWVHRQALPPNYPKSKTLVVTINGPVVKSWKRHFNWIQPDLKVVMLDPKARGRSWMEFVKSDADVLVMHWEAVQLMQREFLSDIIWFHVIADECHKIKNRKTKAAESLKKIKANHKTGLSGTPSTGRPDDLWSILNWLYPQDYRSYWKFVEKYCNVEIMYPQGYRKVTGPKNERELQRLIEPFTCRRLADDHLDLPPIQEQTYWVEMTPQQKQAYDQMKEDMVAWVETEKRRALSDNIEPIIAQNVVAKLVRLQQFASAYATITPDGHVKLADPSSKLDLAEDLIHEAIEAGHKVTVFSHFKQMIDLLEARLDKSRQALTVKITGDVKEKDRNIAQELFQYGNANVFLGTIGAGGEGIDLFASNTLIFLNRDWNPAKNRQAIGRIKRDGQKASFIHVIDIMVENTVEIEKMKTVEMKWSWVEQLLGDNK